MPWKNQGGGPWGPGPKGPWSSGPQTGGPRPPDLEDLLRRGQDRLQQWLPGGHFSSVGVGLVVIGAIVIWLLSGVYRVQSEELGVVLRFGKYVREEQPGLRYHLPYPIETVQLPKALRVNTITIGITSSDDPARRGRVTRDVPEESLMLTGDENIVDVDFTVLWRIKPKAAADFLFNIQNPEGTVKAVAESAMREVIGRSDIQPILTGARTSTEQSVQELMQKTLDHYGAGIQIAQVQMQKVDPPAQVIESFRDVQAARADLERKQNEAQSYANSVVPGARGQASKILQTAEGYKEQAMAEARGQSARFLKVYEEYKKAPDVTRERIYLETMERVLGGADKLVYDGGPAQQGVVPLLPLGDLAPRRQGPIGTVSPGGTSQGTAGQGATSQSGGVR
jgi:modulator of FtsH protease HflK